MSCQDQLAKGMRLVKFSAYSAALASCTKESANVAERLIMPESFKEYLAGENGDKWAAEAHYVDCAFWGNLKDTL